MDVMVEDGKIRTMGQFGSYKRRNLNPFSYPRPQRGNFENEAT